MRSVSRWLGIGIVLLGACGHIPPSVTYRPPTREVLRTSAYQKGDLPHGYFSGLNKDPRPPFYDRYGIPGSPVELTLDLGNPPLSGYGTGAIIVSWFPTEAMVLEAYTELEHRGESEALTPPIGEQAFWFTNRRLGSGGVVFKRCGVIVYLQMAVQPYYPTIPITRETIIQYAHRADTRIQTDVCPVTQSSATTPSP